MSKIRVHELAKELGRQNREVLNFLADKGFELKSHMSMVEDEQVDMVRKRYGKKAEALKTKVENIRAEVGKEVSKENEQNEQKVETGQGEAPKKKPNITQVFHPQNSRTGMVRPGSRPQGQRQGARPAQGSRPAQPGQGTRPAAASQPARGVNQNQAQPSDSKQVQPVQGSQQIAAQGQDAVKPVQRPQGQVSPQPQSHSNEAQEQAGTRPVQASQPQSTAARPAQPSQQGAARPAQPAQSHASSDVRAQQAPAGAPRQDGYRQ